MGCTHRYVWELGLAALRYRHGLATGMPRKLATGLLLAAICARAWATDENSALALIEHGTVAMRANPDESKQDAERALEIIRGHPDADLEIRARLLLCDYYSERDDGAAHREIDAANALLAQAQRKGLRAGVLTCQGETLETGGDNASAKRAFDEAVAVATTAKDEQMLAEALFSRGYLRALQGEYATGMSDVRRSQELFDRIHMPQHALTVLNTIATIYNRMGDYEQAAEIYERARSQQHDAGLRRDEAVSLHNLGRARQRLQEWDAARAGYAGCLVLSHELKYTRGEAYALLGLASVDNATGNPNGALSTLAQATELQRRTPDARLNAQIQLARGTALRVLQRRAEALLALEQSETVFKQANSLDELGTTYDELAIVEAQMGDWQSAYQYRTAAQTTSEELLHNQLDQRFATLKVEFDTATKEKENALLLSQNAANQKALAQERRASTLQTIVILLSLLLLGLLTVLVLRQRRGARHMRVLAMTDELTGAPNRRAVLGHLEALLQRGGAPPCSILIIDIDHFKSINDQHGHAIGDVTLRILTTKLRNSVVEPAFLGRLGGEEFVVALPNTTLQDAYLIAERIRVQVPLIDLSRWLDARRITVSIGVTTSTSEDTVSTVLRRADAALYAAKHAGRDCVRTDLPVDIEATTVWCETTSV
jgi:diguanylate cyclase (GGDEF)-like protein